MIKGECCLLTALLMEIMGSIIDGGRSCFQSVERDVGWFWLMDEEDGFGR